MEAGTKETLHLHIETEQFFYILEGEAVIYLGEDAVELHSGQCISIKPQRPHYILNPSSQALRFLVISAPGNPLDRENIK